MGGKRENGSVGSLDSIHLIITKISIRSFLVNLDMLVMRPNKSTAENTI